MFYKLLVALILIYGGDFSITFTDKLEKLQELIEKRDVILGESEYECYNNGECALEYKMGDLVTYRQEPLCARDLGPAGCGGLVTEEVKLERKRRSECMALRDQMDPYCAGKKRLASEECRLVMEKMEECGDIDMSVQKRALSCPDGWSLSRTVCYKYFPGPNTFTSARQNCERQTEGDNSGLATLEYAISADRREFFNNLIASSGSVEMLNKTMEKYANETDAFNFAEWQEYFEYYDNWAWIGVRRVGDDWKWISHHKGNSSDWNTIKTGHSDWYEGQPTKVNSTDVAIDNGNCVTYFQHENSDGHDIGAWWNVECQLKLPFLCEQDAS